MAKIQSERTLYGIYDTQERKVVGSMRAPSGWLGCDVLCERGDELYVLGTLRAQRQLTPKNRQLLQTVPEYVLDEAYVVVRRVRKGEAA